MRFVVMTTLLSIMIYSCAEEEPEVSLTNTTSRVANEENEEMYRTVSDDGQVINYFYYMDEEETEYYSLDNKDLYTVVTTEPNEDGTEGVFKIWSFTTRQGYIDFGRKNGGDLEIGLKFEEHMRAYAESSGALAYFEETGTVPDWYNEYNKEYYESLFGPVEEQDGRTENPFRFFFTTTSLFTDAFPGQGRHTLMLGWSPWLVWGWNDEVSRFYNTQFWGVTTLHDRWAYQDPFFSVWNWGWQDVQFIGPFAWANDRMSRARQLY